MIEDNLPPLQTPAETGLYQKTNGSYVDWAAIIAGGVFALAISSLLITFGTGLGLSLTSPYRGEGVSASWLAIAAGIWFAWVMVTGFGAGGYLAGRMRRQIGDATSDEVETRDGAHGLMVWATGALVGTILASASVGGLASLTTSAVSSATGTVSEAASSDYFANLMLRNTIVLPDENTTTDSATPSIGNTNSATLSNQRNAQSAGGTNAEVRTQIASIIARNADSDTMMERDSNYLAQLIAANSDLSIQEARTRVDEVNAEINDVRATALEAAEKARIAGVVFGFIAAATLLVGALAAFFAATAGGRHRDEGLGMDVLLARR